MDVYGICQYVPRVLLCVFLVNSWKIGVLSIGLLPVINNIFFNAVAKTCCESLAVFYDFLVNNRIKWFSSQT